jgi:muramoyltetrapeptide carboxypeptidase
MLAKKIKKGDTIGIVAPSFEVSDEAYENYEYAKAFFEKKGFKIKTGKHIREKWFGSAGRPEARAEDLNSMFADKDVNAIICLNGGGTCNTMLPYVDFDLIAKNPKIIMGYSDISVLNQVIWQKTGLVTFNGPLFQDFKNEAAANEYYTEFEERFIKGEKTLPKDPKARTVKPGKASGILVGTNVKCSMNLMGTPYQVNYDDKIVALEAWGISNYECAVRFSQLRQAGVFDHVRGIAVGYVYALQDVRATKGEKLDQMEDILADILSDTDIPILKYNKFGHEMINAIIPIGTEVTLDADRRVITIDGEFIED